MHFRIVDAKAVQRLFMTLSLLSGMSISLPARSAETLYFDYGILGQSLSISSLEKFAEDGTVDAELASYLRGVSSGNRQEIQQILSTPFLTSGNGIPDRIREPFGLSQWLQSPIGEQVLAGLGQLIQTEGRQNGQQAIRAAMVLAAADPAGLSPINILRFYPTGGVRLNLPTILELAEAIETNINTTDQVVEATIQYSVAAAASEPMLDYAALPILADRFQFEVVKQSLILDDRDRNRTYPTDLYLPADLDAVPGPIPVIVFSHGYGDTRTHSETVASAHSLAANGFAVAVPEHIGSNNAYQNDLVQGLTRESFDVMEFVNRPLDIRFLLDTLEQKNTADFQGRLQLDRVGLAGHSFGGYTTLATAGATIDIERLEQQCDLEAEITPDTVNIALLLQCRLLELKNSPDVLQQLTDGSLADNRIGLALAFSPLSNLFEDESMGHLQMPIIIIGGTHDIATPIVQEQLIAFQSLTTPDKYFYLAENLSHTTALTRAILALAYPNSDLVERFDAGEPWLFNLMVTLLIAHGKFFLLEDTTYSPYLTSSYVEAVSVDPTKLHLLRTLPPCLSSQPVSCAENSR
ncbi:MAG: alpha/beta hydrolase [Cyanobacteria bacterium P01_F01_bin.150]